jgi:hypothetical protein
LESEACIAAQYENTWYKPLSRWLITLDLVLPITACPACLLTGITLSTSSPRKNGLTLKGIVTVKNLFMFGITVPG